MSKGWYVKVATQVVFDVDTNIGVVASCEREAGLKAQEILCDWLDKDDYAAELEKVLPWELNMGDTMWHRSGGSGGIDFDTMQALSITPDSDFDPDPDPVTDVQNLMESAQCLNEAFHDLPKDHELVKWRENNGIAVARTQINLCAVLCDQTHRIMLNRYDYDDCYDWDFCPKFLEFCVDYEKFEPKSDNPQHLANMFRMGLQNA